MSFLACPPRHKLAEIAHRRCDLARSPRFALLALGGFGFLLASLWRRALRRRGQSDQSLPAAPPAPPAVRSAEKSRVASCAFADAVARLSIDTFRALCERAQVQYTQTCMAAVVALDSPPDGGTPRLTVLSVGAGTKFARAAAVAADRAGTSIRDCHAEVLARRGLQRALQVALLRAVGGGDSGDGGSGGSGGGGGGGSGCSGGGDGGGVRDRGGGGDGDGDGGGGGDGDGAQVAALLSPPAEAGGTWSLRPGVSLHLYTSSAPCGNASVRRWARCDGLSAE